MYVEHAGKALIEMVNGGNKHDGFLGNLIDFSYLKYRERVSNGGTEHNNNSTRGEYMHCLLELMVALSLYFFSDEMAPLIVYSRKSRVANHISTFIRMHWRAFLGLGVYLSLVILNH